MTKCPVSGCEAQTSVTDSRFEDGSILRRRRCKNGHVFKTVEMFTDEKPNPPGRPKSVDWDEIEASLVEAGLPEHIVKRAIVRVKK